MGSSQRLCRVLASIIGGALLSGSMAGCAYLSQPRPWGKCAVIGGLVGAGIGSGIGVAINESTGDHENMIASTLGGAGVGLVTGAVIGHFLCDQYPPAPPPPPPLPPSPPPP